MKKTSNDQMNDLNKIIIQSDELKRKVRIRVPKDSLTASKMSKSSRKSRRDESIYLGIADSERKSGEPSEFRRRSAHWRDGEKIEVNDNEYEDSYDNEPSYISDEPGFFERIKSYSPLQWACVAMAAVIFITSVMTTSVYADYKGAVNKARAFAELPSYNDMADMELASITEEVVEEVEPEVFEEPQQAQGSVLSLVLTSVEKDLKIKLVDEEDTLVKGVSWGVTVADDSNNQSTYDDDDTDGIIHITDINAGDYSVTINSNDSLNGYTIPSTASRVSVKAKVEYKVIANIRDEIKSEKEVNAAAEDANGNQAADVETGTKLTDTVAWCESTKTESGERYVEASVDLSKCETAKATLGELILNAIGRFIGASKNTEDVATANIRLVADVLEHEHGSFTYSPADSTHHTKTCGIDGCTYSTTEDCSFGDDNKCVCGNTKAAQCAHGNVSYTSNNNGTHKKVCSDCNATVAESEACEYENGKCKKCGYIKPADSIAVTGVKLDQTALSLAVGKTGKLTATIEPNDATNKSVTWASSNSSVASVGNDGTVTGVAAGTAKITATTADGSKTATCEVTVTADSSEKKYKSTSKLYDSAGNKLYKKSGDNYSEATYQDILDGISSFFRKESGYIYTGWQTIDNKTYYYKADHSYVTGDQVIGGVLYHFGSDGTLTQGSGTLGIDVSKYQPSINWASVKASGISYVIIRCGYRGASTGVLIQDPYFTSHIKGAKAAGLKVGVYFFSTALNEAEAVEEASMCAALCSGYGINYPVFIDVESSSRPGYNSLPAAQRTANIKAFCNTVKSAGYTPGVYANKTWFTSYINTSQLSGYKIWLAQYNAAGPTYSGRYDLWQYTSKGSVNGISGNVDMNQSYLGY